MIRQFRRKPLIAAGAAVCLGIAALLFVMDKHRNDQTAAALPSAGSDKSTQELPIVSSVLTNPSTVEITFGGKLSPFSASDLAIKKAQGTWYGLEPLLSSSLPVNKVTTKENKSHQTVAVMELEQALNPDATFSKEEVILPGKAPYFTADYYTGSREQNIEQANHLISWQMDNGGWFKNMSKEYKKPWDGKVLRSEWRTKDGQDIGTIDNEGTTNELLFMAMVYKDTGDSKYKASALRAIDFLLKMQYSSGGWPQVYPARGNYSDYVTFNDNAMMRVMNVLALAVKKKYPFDTDLIDDDRSQAIQHSLDRGLEYILKSQIIVDGKRTAWCAQHDPVTYEPRPARAYEFPSISGSESVAIVQYLMSLQKPSEEVKDAIEGALNWFEEVRLKGIKYVPRDPNKVYFVPDAKSSTWYRFYEIGTNLPIFSGRDSVIRHDLNEIDEERRNGYAWAGTWPDKLLQTARTTGYFENHVYVQVVQTDSKSPTGQTLQQGQLSVVTAPDLK
ncbi:pectate lyase [Paenibacillus sp. 32352]|uniref:pectate lyase n=1 Tax=Paenibacillus sp. 32352 TaxID=1969111 RepID=UPI0015C429A0|nr:pectate lyase [Paenibacillus sp. 32352]